MMRYSYKAKEGPKKVVSGVIEAENWDMAIAQILRAGLTPLDVKADAAVSARDNVKPAPHFFSFSKRIPQSEVVLFIRLMGDLIDAGVPILSALQIVRKQAKHPRFAEVIEQLHGAVQDGAPLSTAMGKFSDVFPPLYVNMVKAGELGGNLEKAMNRLADFVESDQETVAQVRSSLIYPLLILIVGILTVFALLTWVIPRITVIFEEMGSALPFPTRIIMGVSDFFARFWWLVIGLGAGLIYYGRQASKTPAGRLWFDSTQLKIPLIGDFIRDAEIGRFARTLGTLLDSGVVILAALDSVRLVIGNVILREELQKIHQQVLDGASLTDAVKGKRFFSDAAVSMISVGEASGQLHQGLFKLAAYYERRTRRFMKTILSLMEPALILFIGSVVGFVVIAMLMPMFQMNLMIQ